ncbi:DUF4238 domain-containing protein [uncultured Eubacterium sp.]|uniref:DUF4238 domain-containing protein n=1 Tax=uncultured Eubacterium sp. TaxID=165185 RepID=UPI002591C4E8|nr:DUF4238 domain-containing protein [uncultured Eubacterium sp.]
MEEKDLPKIKQHFVPQVYLRGFSPEYEPIGKSNIPKEKFTIFSYDVEKKEYDSTEAIPISSICYKKKLYEIYGEDEQIILPNWLENYLCAFEKMFGIYRTNLERKTQRENIGTHNFLRKKEKVFWVTFIVIHLLRNAYALSEAEAAIKECVNDNVSDKEITSIVRKLCLPFFQEINENTQEAKILEEILTPMYNMQFAVGVDFDNQLITSDKGISVIAKEFPTDEYNEVIFPITSSICLFLFGNDHKDMYKDNILFELSENGKKHVISSVVLDAYKKIYSNHRFNVSEKKYIKEIANERKSLLKDEDI